MSEKTHMPVPLEPERYAGHLNVVERFIAGLIQPADLAGVLQWMGLTTASIWTGGSFLSFWGLEFLLFRF